MKSDTTLRQHPGARQSIRTTSATTIPPTPTGQTPGSPRADQATEGRHRGGPPGRGERGKGGAITVFYGTATGLAQGPSFGQDSPGVPGTDEAGDGFGESLAVGDVNGDGYADVAIAAKTEDISGVPDAGSVTLLKGSPQGLTATGAQAWNQNSPGVPGGNENADEFGAYVSLIDHNNDGKADLSVGADEENNTGAVTLLKGAATGITTSGAVTWVLPGWSRRIRAYRRSGYRLKWLPCLDVSTISRWSTPATCDLTGGLVLQRHLRLGL